MRASPTGAAAKRNPFGLFGGKPAPTRPAPRRRLTLSQLKARYEAAVRQAARYRERTRMWAERYAYPTSAKEKQLAYRRARHFTQLAAAADRRVGRLYERYDEALRPAGR